MVELPSGTLTFLFTDLEGSTALWEAHAEVMGDAVARHDELLTGCVEANNGQVLKTTGDGLVAVFAAATDGVAAALACQQALTAADGPVPLKSRMGLYTGEASPHDGDYHGPVLNRASRVMSAGHGGQVLLSSTTAALVRSEFGLLDLGEHRLRDLGRPERLFQLIHPDLERRFPALRTLDSLPSNLPLQVSSFVGRDEERAVCVEALFDHRLVTLTGVGGVGKTRLALQVAGEVLPRFRDGVWLVELAPVRDPDGIASAVASTFGLPPGPKAVEALEDAFEAKQLLLVLDNCEHLVAGVAELAGQLLSSCAGLRVMATSREGLLIPGEQLIGVPPLSAGGRSGDVERALDSDAVTLFVERARNVDPGFEVTAHSARDVVEICRRLDGVPLAIELAAARVVAFGPRDLAARLDHRFDMLAGGHRGAVERHATLRATVDWSYDLLTEEERVVLARLSVFSGTFHLEAVEGVCRGDGIEAHAVFDLLAALVERSLVVAERHDSGTRYRLLETIRQYGEERLGSAEVPRLREAHARYYADYWIEDRDLPGPQRPLERQRLAAELENAMAAYRFALDTGDVDVALRLAIGTRLQDAILLFAEDIPTEPIIRELPSARSHPLYPAVLALAAERAGLNGDHDRELALLEQAEDQYEPGRDARLDRLLPARMSAAKAYRALRAGRFREAASGFEATSRQYQEAGASETYAYSISSAAMARFYGGLPDAEHQAREALDIARASGDPQLVTNCQISLAMTLARQDPDHARQLLAESVSTLIAPEKRGTQVFGAVTSVALDLEDWDLAAALAHIDLGAARWTPDALQTAQNLAACARHLFPDDPEAAEILVGAAYAAGRRGYSGTRSGTDRSTAPDDPPPLPAWSHVLRATHRMAIEHFGQDRAEQLRNQGLSMSIPDAISYALSHTRPLPISLLLDERDGGGSAEASGSKSE